MALMDLQTILLSGLVLGSMYALMATGLSIVWGTLRVFNFAHVVFFTLGAYSWRIRANFHFRVFSQFGTLAVSYHLIHDHLSYFAIS